MNVICAILMDNCWALLQCAHARPAVLKADWLRQTSPAFRLMIATSWLAPERTSGSWRAQQEKAIRDAVEAGPDWSEYLNWVYRNETAGVSWPALRRVAGITVPEAAARELRERSDACRRCAVLQSLMLADVLKRFEQASIPALPFKGQVLCFGLYGDVGFRYSCDLDVQVALEDLERAQKCLEGIGWQLHSTFFPMSPRQWDSLFRHELHLNFVHPRTGCLLELHWRLQRETPQATAARWARSIPAVWQDCSILSMQPADLTLYLCSHGGRHLWYRAKWLGDLARAHAIGLLNWEASFELARQTAEERVLLAGLGLLREVYSLPLPDLPESVWKHWSTLLVEIPIRALTNSSEAPGRVGPAKLRHRLHNSSFHRLLWRRKSRWSTLSDLFYGREDFRTVPLADSFFWAYKPLRPILWLWRWAGQPGNRSSLKS
jgi:hypothetical protein